ncbi:MAG: efflux RND transporter permease subunit [Candidatus Nitronauta litoralis]|uniref:Efflux RND transporter permease subunit n=1 Tax=Candidatus Nitronauta litoralis TaxID=2705533 RepID=A0A7T0BXJ1_9BACT|nr:MAG: efflux RND transporter permease subunit [Candidatus Nitronauta litoralis]
MKNLGNNLTELGVRRPVLITVINLLIMLAGLGSLMGIDVRELPDVDRPVVSVRAIYEGASPETMDTEVTSILEGAVARVSGVKNIKSSSEENNMRLHVEFQPEIDLNDAASDVREAVSRVQRELPEDIDQLVVLKADDDASAIVQIAAFSGTLSKQALAKRIEKDVSPELLSISGVADVQLNGDQPRVLRVLLDPARMAGYRLSVSEVVEVLRQARFDVPAGSYESNDQELIVRAYASVVEPEKVERLHIRDTIRVSDVGTVFYSPMEAESYSLLNGRMVIGLGVVRQAGANTIAISNEVNNRVQRINERSRDFTLSIISDDSIYIRGALEEVLWTLGFAILIVLIVIAVFLGQWRAVLVPAVTMPISLVGTLVAIWLLGFSINLLTLLALVLATGLIVDDAIVVLENIQRLRSKGYESLVAAVFGTRQVFFAVIATTITLVAVFFPIAFLPGETGRLFREFGLVLAIAVTISSFVAVTLCPMLASRIPDSKKPNIIATLVRNGLNALGRGFGAFYFKTLNLLLSWSWLAIPLSLLIAGGGVLGFQMLNQELLPQEDRGSLSIILTGPDGASLAYSDRQSRKVEAVLQPYQAQGLITDIYTIVGRWDKNRTYTEATLIPWEDRKVTQMALAKEVTGALKDMPGAQVRLRRSNSLNVRGAGSGLEIALVGNDYKTLSKAADLMADALKNRVPEIDDIRIDFDTSQPELAFNIDREKARDLRVPMDRISQTLRVMVDKFELIDLSIEDQAVPIMVGSTQGAINDPGDLLNIFVTNLDNELVPLSTMINVRETGVAAELDRHAQRRAIEMDLGVPPGTALGKVLNQVRSVAADVLPKEVNILFLGEAATLEESSYDVAVTFAIALAVVLLVLAAQFESLGSALIVIFTVPFGLAAAIFALLKSGQSINLYSQIGLVMLVGLMTKNAILLVEFMDQMRDEGMSVHDAIMEGVRVRLRPVTMTVMSTVVGALPLILSTGPGAEAREAIGWVVFGGLGLSTLFTLYLAPVGYYWIAPFIKPRAQAGDELKAQLERVEQDGLKMENA